MSEREPWPVGKISPLGPAYHRTGPDTWHEHDEAGHRHDGGDRLHLHRDFPPEQPEAVPETAGYDYDIHLAGDQEGISGTMRILEGPRLRIRLIVAGIPFAGEIEREEGWERYAGDGQAV